ncbi:MULTISPECIES: (4Fe-4S)-binding protein [Aestuariibaculum]|uniref:(4Fe-4S)-binding protein n=1 Tax=Aestuariibaculum lutulentum TaxID=2920935 RepID=A0ABS9REE1_9FLAO|nr:MULTISPECIES: (4Fe-4S)-binding protein [Aestuariibaculum]MCH4551303.1 (4Fe-4S)-binding protein [Aestuariibaculum lutulentum]MCR8666422.1 (4Fe-4S)-binding protein [Aestuariibaculum sp. M13]
MKTEANTFSNSEITVTYEPNVCIHAEKCIKELSDVFRTSIIPWIDLDGSDAERIIKQVNRCPSGALQFKRKLIVKKAEIKKKPVLETAV